MKKFLITSLATLFLVSCSKTEMQQTTDTIKSADSLLQSAKDGFKTLDSISKIVNDSTKINSEIKKQTENVEKVIRENTKDIDSLNSVIQKTTEKITKNADLIKTVDSAGKVLKESKNPIDALSTISKTLEKVSKKSASTNNTQTETPQTPKNPATSSDAKKSKTTTQIDPTSSNSVSENISQPISKNGTIELNVQNIGAAQKEITTNLQRYGGEIVAEHFGQQGNEKKQVITAKIPYQYFDAATNSISQNIGVLKTKSIETEGTDYNPDQICNLEITLTENMLSATESISEHNTAETAKNDTEKSFLEKFGTTGLIILVCLILIPIMLLIIYLMNRQMKKKMEESIQQKVHQEKQNYSQRNSDSSSGETAQKQQESGEDPYEKYKPR